MRLFRGTGLVGGKVRIEIFVLILDFMFFIRVYFFLRLIINKIYFYIIMN